jgi:hypothetical protein
VLRRLDAIAASLERIEARVQEFSGRLDRVDRWLWEVEARLDRIERAAAANAGAETPGSATPSRAPAGGTPAAGDAQPTVTVVDVLLTNRWFSVRQDTGDEYVHFAVEGVVKDLKQAARLKAKFVLMDRFGAVKKTYDLVTEVMRPGERLLVKVPFRLTRTAEEDLWLRRVDRRELKGRVEVEEVLYGVEVQDGPGGR